MLDATQAKDLVKLAVLVEKIANTGITATIAAGDIEIGAVEIKNGTTDTRGTVLAASTAAADTDTAMVVAISPNNSVSTKETPDATTTYCPNTDVSVALEASSVSKASAGVFYGLSGYNSLASAQWILVYNSATVPANGAVTPIAVIRAAASSNFSFDSGKFGIFCSAGISWSNSTDATIFNKTLGAADCFVNVQYK